MDFMNLISATALSNAIGDLIYKYLYGWIINWSNDWSVIGAFSVTVIMFTVFLKVAVFPLDIWQKEVMRKNAKKMEKMRPALEKAQKQCGSIYKEDKYSMVGSCLPMIVTMVVFFIVFGGYNAAVAKHTEITYNALDKIYTEVYYAEENAALSDDEKTKKAQDAVLDAYEKDYSESFFWIKSIFAADTWADTIPNAATAQKTIKDLNTAKYDIVMKPLMDKYNEGWNGYLILPLLVLGLNILSIFLNKQQMQQPSVPGQTEEQAKAQQSQAKIMQFII